MVIRPKVRELQTSHVRYYGVFALPIVVVGLHRGIEDEGPLTNYQNVSLLVLYIDG